jgi:hypothetical protein
MANDVSVLLFLTSCQPARDLHLFHDAIKRGVCTGENTIPCMLVIRMRRDLRVMRSVIVSEQRIPRTILIMIAITQPLLR